MTLSVHSNKTALLALQNLNKTNDQLADVQNRVNTGLMIANAKDNAAVWAIAQGQRADIGALGQVGDAIEACLLRQVDRGLALEAELDQRFALRGDKPGRN